MSHSLESDQVLEQFIRDLAVSASGSGWQLVRFYESHTDRAFELRGDGRAAAFTAKVSLSTPLFWGLTKSKAAEIVQSKREHLILLTGPSRGKLISAVAFERLFPKFSRTQDGAIRINPKIVRSELPFDDAESAFKLLKARAFTPAA